MQIIALHSFYVAMYWINIVHMESFRPFTKIQDSFLFAANKNPQKKLKEWK